MPHDDLVLLNLQERIDKAVNSTFNVRSRTEDYRVRVNTAS
jgi:hypothetical protein